MNSRVRVERSQLVQEITPGGYVRESQRVCISGYGKGIIVIRFRFRSFFAQLNGFASLMLSAVLPHLKLLADDCARF